MPTVPACPAGRHRKHEDLRLPEPVRLHSSVQSASICCCKRAAENTEGLICTPHDPCGYRFVIIQASTVEMLALIPAPLLSTTALGTVLDSAAAERHALRLS
jgi:hypothetical protein